MSMEAVSATSADFMEGGDKLKYVQEYRQRAWRKLTASLEGTQSVF